MKAHNNKENKNIIETLSHNKKIKKHYFETLTKNFEIKLYFLFHAMKKEKKKELQHSELWNANL